MQTVGKIQELEMYEIFNMGIGMVLAVAPEKVPEVLATLAANNEKGYMIGSVVSKESEEKVVLKEKQL